jgi:hypothetical protein
MMRLISLAFLAAVLAGCAGREIPATKLERADVLPLALDDDFQFRKQKTHFYDGLQEVATPSETVNFERRRLIWGTTQNFERQMLYGNYYTFFWRANREADITVRLEYRQAALGNYVMAQERYYPAARGNYVSRFEVIGDDFLEFGRVTSWRALLIVEGKIVALRQSFIWR